MTRFETMEEGPGRSGGWRVLRIIGMVLGGLALAVIAAFVFGLFVQLLWNWLMPSLFGLAKLTYWQAFGIIVLAKLIFSPFGVPPRPGRGHWRHFGWNEDWRCGDEAWKPNGSHRNWRHYGRYWREQGKAHFESWLNGRSDKEEDEAPVRKRK
jgi:hypothetical protein